MEKENVFQHPIVGFKGIIFEYNLFQRIRFSIQLWDLKVEIACF